MIICGTDLSESSFAAARTAALIAKRLGAGMALAHVVDPSQAPGATESVCDELRARAESLAAEIGIDVEVLVERGVADEKLVALAASATARFLVVSSTGKTTAQKWLLGSVADSAVRTSQVPVLVVREGDAIDAWARGERALRVMVGVEPTVASRAVLRFAESLRAIGRCELVVAQIAWPAEEHRRADLPPPIPLDRLRPELEEVLLRELESWAGPDESDRTFVVKAGWGRVDRHLTQLAKELSAHLVVVGTHQRAGIAALWRGSVSRGVLHDAETSVACVPLHER